MDERKRELLTRLLDRAVGFADTDPLWESSRESGLPPECVELVFAARELLVLLAGPRNMGDELAAKRRWSDAAAKAVQLDEAQQKRLTVLVIDLLLPVGSGVSAHLNSGHVAPGYIGALHSRVDCAQCDELLSSARALLLYAARSERHDCREGDIHLTDLLDAWSDAAREAVKHG